MEKVLYLLVRDEALPAQGFADHLLAEVAPAVVAAGSAGVQINVEDAAVEAARSLRFTNSSRPPSAVVSVWLPSAVEELRRSVDHAVAAAGARVTALLVTESQPIVYRSPVGPDGRTTGFAQLAFLQRPARLTEAQWLDIWLDHHTAVAVETQATFGYTQNVVARTLVGGPGYDAVVEELFPTAAMDDQQAFYDAVGDEAKLVRNRDALMASVERFVDLDRIDVVPTSRYVVQPPVAPLGATGG